MKKAAALILSMLIMLSLCACLGEKKTVLVISGAEIDNEVFIYFLDKVIQRPTDYGLTENPERSGLKEAAINQCKEYLLANSQFRDAGLTLSAAEKVDISNAVNDLWIRFERHYKEIGVSKQTLTKIQTSQAYNDVLFTANYDKGSADAAAEKEIQDYFYSNYVSFRTACAYFTLADGTAPMSQLEKNGLLASFESLSGKSSGNAEDIIRLVQATGYSLSSSILLKRGSDGYPAGFFEKVYEQADNTVQIIVYDECVFAVYKENLQGKGESVYANYRSACISDLYSEQAQARVLELIKGLTVEEKGRNIDRIVAVMA